MKHWRLWLLVILGYAVVCIAACKFPDGLRL